MYSKDFVAWTEQQSELLRSQQFKDLDFENLAEEIYSLGNEQKHKVDSYLRQLLKHLLLYQYWESEREYCGSGWIDEIGNFRFELEQLLESKTLYNHLIARFDYIYSKARKQAIAKSKLKDIPEVCPYKVADVLNEDFLPPC
jgi:hypothetical protein